MEAEDMNTIIDLHCDLLSYLSEIPQATPMDAQARCSIPQLIEGKVETQVLAIYTVTGPHSLSSARRQLEWYHRFKKEEALPLQFLVAVENSSGFCGEEEPLSEGLNRLDQWIEGGAKPLYISLTWNGPNRFGGGTGSDRGLTQDGQALLQHLDSRGIALDLSHASDPLLYEAMDYVDQQGLEIPLLASHSNSRSVCPAPRNLPDDVLQELFKRGSLVGLNFFKEFVGASADHLLGHIEKFLELGGEKSLCFGADFFFPDSLPPEQRKPHGKELFFSELATAACYGPLCERIRQQLGLEASIVEGLQRENVSRFLSSL